MCGGVCPKKERKNIELKIFLVTERARANLNQHYKDESSNRGDGHCQVKAVRFELYQEAQLLVSVRAHTMKMAKIILIKTFSDFLSTYRTFHSPNRLCVFFVVVFWQ